MAALKPAGFSESDFRRALGRFPSGVTVVTASDPDSGSPIGLTISSFTSVSLQPPMILWTLTHTAKSLGAFMRLERYVIHVLSSGQHALARRFAQGDQAWRFSGIATRRTALGTLALADPDCAARFECRNAQHHEAGDHTIFVGEVLYCESRDLAPLIYHAGELGHQLAPAMPGADAGIKRKID